MIRRLAHALVHRYPQAWRERYEAEVRALIDESPLRFRDLAELSRGLLTERLRELVASDDRPRRTAWILTVAHPLFAVAWVGLAASLGFALRSRYGHWPEPAQETAAWGLIVAMLAFGVLLFRTRRRPWGLTPAYPAWAAAVGLSAIFVGVVVVLWGIEPSSFRSRSVGELRWLPRAYNWFLLVTIAADLTGGFWPSLRMLEAFGALEGAERQLRVSQTWVESCREWIAKGVASPLGEAQAQVERWTRERDTACERLHALGYRARFRELSSGGQDVGTAN